MAINTEPRVALVPFELVRSYLTESQQAEVMSSACRRLKEQYDLENLHKSIIAGTEAVTKIRESIEDRRTPKEDIGGPVEADEAEAEKTKFQLTGSGKVINLKAIEILNQALALGCKWAEEELKKYPQPETTEKLASRASVAIDTVPLPEKKMIGTWPTPEKPKLKK